MLRVVPPWRRPGPAPTAFQLDPAWPRSCPWPRSRPLAGIPPPATGRGRPVAWPGRACRPSGPPPAPGCAQSYRPRLRTRSARPDRARPSRVHPVRRCTRAARSEPGSTGSAEPCPEVARPEPCSTGRVRALPEVVRPGRVRPAVMGRYPSAGPAPARSARPSLVGCAPACPGPAGSAQRPTSARSARPASVCRWDRPSRQGRTHPTLAESGRLGRSTPPHPLSATRVDLVPAIASLAGRLPSTLAR